MGVFLGWPPFFLVAHLSAREMRALSRKGDPGGMEGEGDFFPPCGGFQQFSDGPDCAADFLCLDSFKCQGHWWDDFECENLFLCGDGETGDHFDCFYSFDSEDCENSFQCNSDACFRCRDGGFTFEPL